jgi:pSer/pThr/pTyr-binding forkhead associated (FHA) protein
LQTPHLPIIADQILVGRGENCDICLNDQTVSRILCILRYLEVFKFIFAVEEVILLCFLAPGINIAWFSSQQGGPCELEVTGKKGRVQVNGASISKGTKIPLIGGDEVVLGECGKHAYVSLLTDHVHTVKYVHFVHLSFIHRFCMLISNP